MEKWRTEKILVWISPEMAFETIHEVLSIKFLFVYYHNQLDNSNFETLGFLWYTIEDAWPKVYCKQEDLIWSWLILFNYRYEKKETFWKWVDP